MKLNSRLTKIISIVLCLCLLCGGVWALAYNTGADNAVKTEKSADKAQDAKTDGTAAKTGDGVTKDETVYVMSGADGTVNKIVVSDWIKNDAGSDKISDKSELRDIEMTNGDVSYTMDGDNTRVWDAAGNDVYYEGDLDKELPVDMTVSYKLNGKTVTPEELAGKSGKVTIRFDYKNKQYENVEIDGKTEKIYVPFTMLTGLMLDNENFTNVEVSNGKIINDGSRTVVVGMAFPGLQEDLNLDKKDIEIPDYVEITANATDFELSTTMTIATNELFNEADLDDVDSFDELQEAMDQMTDAMDQLMDGSSELYDNMCLLLSKSGELIDGIDKLAAGAKTLSDGADAIDAGVAEFKAEFGKLSGGLSELSGKSSELTGGARQVFNTLLSTAEDELSKAGLDVPSLTVENYASVLNGIIESLDETNVYNKAYNTALEKVTAEVEKNDAVIREQVTAAVRTEVRKTVVKQYEAGVLSSVLQNYGMTVESYNEGIENGTVDQATQDAVNNAVAAYLAQQSVQDEIDAKTDAAMGQSEQQAIVEKNVQAQKDALIEKNMNSKEVQSGITEALEAAKSGAASVSALKEQLDSYNSFYQGVISYTGYVDSAASGAGELYDAAGELKGYTESLASGAGELYDGISTLKDGSSALVSGVEQLRDGSMQLSDGLKKFNEEGIEKLAKVVNEDLDGMVTRLQAISDVSKDYVSFSGISDGMSGQVKFIYKTDSVEVKDN